MAEKIGDSESVPLSLKKSLELTLVNNPSLSATQSRLDAADSRITQARSGLFPQIDFIENYRRTNNPMYAFGTKLNQERITQDDFDPAVLNDPDTVENFSSTFSLTFPLFNRAQTWIGLKQAKLNYDAVSMGANRTKQYVIAQTLISYTDVLLAQENLSLVEKALATSSAHLKLIDSRFRNGLVVKSDFLRAEVRVAELEQERLLAHSSVAVAKASLNAAMGVDINRPFLLTTALKQGPELKGPLDKWTKMSLDHRPDLAEIIYQQTIAEKEITKAKAAYLPSLNLLSNYEINSEDFNDRAENYTVGAVMHFNLFSGCSQQSKVREAKAGLREVLALRQRLELMIAVETKQAYLQAQSAWQRIQVARAAVVQAEESLRIVHNRYSNGFYTIVNLLDAEIATHSARTNQLRSVHDYTLARIQLALAAGILDEHFDWYRSMECPESSSPSEF